MVKKLRSTQSADIDRETWRQILKAAEDLFMAKGYKGVSMKDVADAVQVTPAALYYHFPQGKEDLFISMLCAMFDDWAASISRAVEPGRNVRERLSLLTAYMLTLPVDHFMTLVRDAREQIKNLDKQHDVFLQMREKVSQRIAEVFQRAIDEAEIKADVPALVLATMYQGMVMSLRYHTHSSLNQTPSSITSSERMETSELTEVLVSVLLDGIGPQE